MKPVIRNLWKVVGVTLFSSLATTACDGTTVVFVTVEARSAMREGTQLEVTVSNDGTSLSQTFDVNQQSFPLTFTVTPIERSGDLRIEALAIEPDGERQIIHGQGRAIVGIDTGDQVNARVLLEPTDFVVNTDVAGDQALTVGDRENGRQLAAAPDGSFTVTFLQLQDCLTLDRCDLYGRRFSPTSVPALSEISQSTDEFQINQSNEPSAASAVAISQSGSTFTVWSTGLDIRGALLTNTGAHTREADLVITDEVAPSDEIFVVDPHVSALPDGQFIVVWAQLTRIDSPSNFAAVIRGRLIDSEGRPTTNPINGDDGSFLISEFTDAPRLAPIAASTSDRGGFVVVWQEGAADLAGRFFGPDSAPLGPATLLIDNDSGIIFTNSLVWVDGTALVAWDFFDVDPRYQNTALVARRFAPPNGQPVGTEILLDRNYSKHQGAMSMAVRPSDNAIGVAWSNCEEYGDDSGCGIFLQMLFPSGLRFGEPFVATTTTTNDQVLPSLAATNETFVLAWTDRSQTAPDSSGAAVRARVLYPEFNVPTGVRGAPCGGDRTACEEGLVCMRGDGDEVSRCYEQCTDPGSPCADGGVCNPDGEVGLAGCTFPPT